MRYQAAQLVRVGSNATHSLHAVKHKPFCSQNRPGAAAYFEGHISRLHLITVFQKGIESKSRVIFAEYESGNIDTGNHTAFFDEQSGSPLFFFGHCRQGGVVSFANVLNESVGDKRI